MAPGLHSQWPSGPLLVTTPAPILLAPGLPLNLHSPYAGALPAPASSHVHPNLCPALSPCPAGPGPAPEGEIQALDFKALSEGAWFAMEVKDKPRNNSARKCVSGEAAQSSSRGRGKGEGGWACSAALPAGARPSSSLGPRWAPFCEAT